MCMHPVDNSSLNWEVMVSLPCPVLRNSTRARIGLLRVLLVVNCAYGCKSMHDREMMMVVGLAYFWCLRYGFFGYGIFLNYTFFSLEHDHWDPTSNPLLVIRHDLCFFFLVVCSSLKSYWFTHGLRVKLQGWAYQTSNPNCLTNNHGFCSKK